jgi:hypothetical protein
VSSGKGDIACSVVSVVMVVQIEVVRRQLWHAILTKGGGGRNKRA